LLGEEEAVAMLNSGLRAMRGFTLVELMLALAILGILTMLALPSLATWIQNTQLRTAAEGMNAGLTLARAEALRRNTVVRFQLVDTLTSSCGFTVNGTNWVVSLADTTGACDVDPSDTTAPQIIQKRSGNEGSSSAQPAPARPRLVVPATFRRRAVTFRYAFQAVSLEP
jgi:type IV fimbrial biogenesis protein FimT